MPSVLQEVPHKPKEIVYTTTAGINEVVKTDKVIVSTITSIKAVDSTLINQVPSFIHTEDYPQSSLVTVVYETPKVNSRILVFYNTETGESRVMDYSKIEKNIVGSTVTEKVNELGQKVYFTDKTETISSSTEYKNIITVAEEVMPTIKGKLVDGIETTVKSTGTEYKLVVVDSGVVNQIVLQQNTNTGKVSFIAKSETSVVSEVIRIVK